MKKIESYRKMWMERFEKEKHSRFFPDENRNPNKIIDVFPDFKKYVILYFQLFIESRFFPFKTFWDSFVITRCHGGVFSQSLQMKNCLCSRYLKKKEAICYKRCNQT